MDRLDWILKKRREVAERYDKLLRNITWIIPPSNNQVALHAYQSYVTLFAPEKPTLLNIEKLTSRRNQLMQQLQDAGIASRPGTQSVPTQKWYVQKYGYHPTDFPKAYVAEQVSLALPLYPQLTAEEQEYVIEVLGKSFSY